MPALVTPFGEDGGLDEDAFVSLVEWQIEEGSDGLVPVGTSGESPTLTHDEHKRLVDLCVKTAAGRVPVIAGAGSNNTVEAVDFAKFAEQAGADAVLVVTPYYNRPSQGGLHLHYTTIAKAIGIPLFIYNIPARSIIDMTPQTMAALARECKNIIGVKDATARMERVSQQRLACGADFVQLSGEDASALGFNAHGGAGCISVTANVAPALCREFQEHSLAGEFAKALKIQDRLMPLHEALFLEPSPGGAKYALSKLGRLNNILRSPLQPVGQQTERSLDQAMAHAGLLAG